jgi:hypothetical protein
MRDLVQPIITNDMEAIAAARGKSGKRSHRWIGAAVALCAIGVAGNSILNRVRTHADKTGAAINEPFRNVAAELADNLSYTLDMQKQDLSVAKSNKVCEQDPQVGQRCLEAEPHTTSRVPTGLGDKVIQFCATATQGTERRELVIRATSLDNDYQPDTVRIYPRQTSENCPSL